MPSATMRAIVSIAPPAGTGTTMITEREGKVCAAAGAARQARPHPLPNAEIDGGEVSW